MSLNGHTDKTGQMNGSIDSKIASTNSSDHYDQIDDEMVRQDELVDRINSTVDQMNDVALEINQKIAESQQTIGELSDSIDNQNSNVIGANRRLDILRKNKENCHFMLCLLLIVLSFAIGIIIIVFVA
jgi:methyl-accepting chemotaxis protein